MYLTDTGSKGKTLGKKKTSCRDNNAVGFLSAFAVMSCEDT